ncbi:MAG: FAD-dependent oxidoreductase [Luminiphilus sp.]|nr:FAD-dependent oxidoreductase [Luminiphilus sp.]
MSFVPMLESDVTSWSDESDVVVVGFGGAGACAAIAASDAGASVVIVEAASASGGSTALSSAEIYLGGGTKIQKAVGYDDSVEDVYGYLMDSNGPQADPKKVRAYAEGGAEHLDWLISLGVPFKPSELKERAMMVLTDDCLLYTGSEKAWPYSTRYKPAPRGHNLEVEGDNGGPLLTQILLQQVKQRGVSIHYETRALRLIVNCYGPQQRVVGLVVRQDMQEHYFRAKKGVVLCAGGFIMNEEMVREYCPQFLDNKTQIGNPNDTGSGIQMGLSVGGRAINMHEGFLSLPFYPPATLTFGIFVNGQGQRFVNEDAYHGRIGSFLVNQSYPVYLILNVADYGNYETESWLQAPVVATGETLDELVSELKLPAGQLEQTLKRFNQDVAEGTDTLFHKDASWLKAIEAPFVALDCTPGAGAFFPCFTLGGLDTTVEGAVCSVHEGVIPGLYAAGRTACGVPRRGDGYASGSSVGDATFSGRMAGCSIAIEEQV